MRSPLAHSSLSVLAVALFAVVLVAGVPLGGEAQAQVWCPKVQVFSAVGAGSRGVPDVPDVLRNEILKPEQASGTDPDLFHGWRVDYPAAGGIPTLLRAFARSGGPYHDSVVKGKDWLRSHVNEKIDHCGDRTQIILTGFG